VSYGSFLICLLLFLYLYEVILHLCGHVCVIEVVFHYFVVLLLLFEVLLCVLWAVWYLFVIVLRLVIVLQHFVVLLCVSQVI